MWNPVGVGKKVGIFITVIMPWWFKAGFRLILGWILDLVWVLRCAAFG